MAARFRNLYYEHTIQNAAEISAAFLMQKTIDKLSLLIYYIIKDKKLLRMIQMKNRNTIQRSLVLEAVNKLQCHATADQIYAEIVKEHPAVSKATVYRNLNLLSEMGEIRKM